MKLLLDMWLGVGSELALPLALRMLQQALYQQEPLLRARAFDVVYNLSLHSCLLSELPAEHGGGWEARTAAAARQAAGNGHRGSGESLPQSASSPRAQHSGGLSVVPSLQIHLPQQILQAPSSPRGSFPAPSGSYPTAAASGAHASSPQSPRSRLSRGDRAGFSPETSPGRRSGHAPSASLLPGQGSVDGQEEQGQLRGQEQQEEEGLEVQLAHWLRQLLFELLQMLSQVRSAALHEAMLAACVLLLVTHSKVLLHSATRPGMSTHNQ